MLAFENANQDFRERDMLNILTNFNTKQQKEFVKHFEKATARFSVSKM